MPKRIKPLTQKEISALMESRGEISVGGVSGLILRARELTDGRKVWKWVLRRQGGLRSTRYKMTLGEYPQMTLAQARARATEVDSAGDNPIVRRQEAREQARAQEAHMQRCQPFDAVAVSTFEELDALKYWKDPRAFGRERQRYAKHIKPVIGARIIQDITPLDVVNLLHGRSCGLLGSGSLAKVRALLGKVFDYATRQGLIEENPLHSSKFRALMKGAPSSSEETQHMPALDPEDLPRFIRALCESIEKAEKSGRSSTGAKCLLFSILTNSRSSNARGAQWREIDLEGRVWVIPSERMKKRENGDHTVYLSSFAVALLKSLPQLPDSPYVFPCARGGALSDAVFGQCIKRLNRERTAVGGAPFVDRKQLDRRGAPREVTQHGIARATYKTWTQTALNERGAPFNVDAVELSLHHKRIGAGGLGGAYEREDFIKERREIAEAWAVFVFSGVEESLKQKILER